MYFRRQLQSLEHSVASDIRLILTLLQQQQQQQAAGHSSIHSSASSIGAEPSASEMETSDSLEHRGTTAVQRSLSIPHTTFIAHRYLSNIYLAHGHFQIKIGLKICHDKTFIWKQKKLPKRFQSKS